MVAGGASRQRHRGCGCCNVRPRRRRRTQPLCTRPIWWSLRLPLHGWRCRPPPACPPPALTAAAAAQGGLGPLVLSRDDGATPSSAACLASPHADVVTLVRGVGLLQRWCRLCL
jgi:hypothetical protein